MHDIIKSQQSKCLQKSWKKWRNEWISLRVVQISQLGRVKLLIKGSRIKQHIFSVMITVQLQKKVGSRRNALSLVNLHHHLLWVKARIGCLNLNLIKTSFHNNKIKLCHKSSNHKYTWIIKAKIFINIRYFLAVPLQTPFLSLKNKQWLLQIHQRS